MPQPSPEAQTVCDPPLAAATALPASSKHYPSTTPVDSPQESPRRKLLGAYLLEAGVVTPENLADAVALAQQAGVRIGRALTTLRLLREGDLVNFLARQMGIPVFELEHQPLDIPVAQRLPEPLARRWQAVLVAIDDTAVTVAMVNPQDGEARRSLEVALDMPLRPLLIAEYALDRALDAVYREQYTHQSTLGLKTNQPHESAFQVITRGQQIAFGLLLLAGLVWLLISPLGFLIGVNALATVFYLAAVLYRLYLVSLASAGSFELPVSDAELAALDDRDLPIYTILVPVYHEANVLPKLMQAISALDYPTTKLDVKLLMEADDHETIAMARALRLPPFIRFVIVPDSLPKTKPKACNYGLLKAQGEFVVIYDAEDLPEPAQLKKAVVAFAKADERVACIQAKLNYYNRDQNLLTRWFTLEYSLWFDLFLPGLDAANAPIPLGGTSNHFRRPILEAIGSWDPFNVTEDADLGIRLYKAGYRTAIIDSTTFEEANSRVHNWIRQRSRWVKGYLQTWLVHMRNPLALWRSIGTAAFLSFNLTVGGTVLAQLLNPIYWSLTMLWFLSEWGAIAQIFPSLIYYMGGFNLLLGNFIFIYLSLAGALHREFYSLVKYALLTPLYWLLMSLGAWKGFIQLFTRPFYWEKTIHGLDHGTSADQHTQEGVREHTPLS